MARHVLDPAYRRVDVDEVVAVNTGEDMASPSLGLSLTRADIFAAD